MSKTLKIDFIPPAPAPGNGYVVKYRPYQSGSAFTNVNFPAGSIPPLTVNGLSDTDDFEGTVESSCSPTFNSSPVGWNALRTQWLADTYTCEQDSVFTLQAQVTGMSTPFQLMYDAPSGRVYGIDGDNPLGNFFYYNPSGFTDASQVVYFPLILQSGASNLLFSYVIDPVHRKMYAMGRDSDGVQIFDCSTNQVSLIPFGCNHNVAPICGSSSVRNGFPRTFLRMIGNSIIGMDKYSNQMISINPATSGINFTKDITTIPQYDKCMIGAPEMIKIGSEYWVLSSQANATEAPNKSPNIYRYNDTFTTVLGTIDLSAYSEMWSFGSYIRSSYFDVDNNKLYIFEQGTGTLIVVDIATTSVIYTKVVTLRQGKTHASLGFATDPITNDLFLTGQFANEVTDSSPISMTYKLDKTTYGISDMYPGVQFANLVRIGGTNELHGAAPGQPGWAGVTGWQTDGKIQKFTR
jgi:hypothetical protein